MLELLNFLGMLPDQSLFLSGYIHQLNFRLTKQFDDSAVLHSEQEDLEKKLVLLLFQLLCELISLLQLMEAGLELACLSEKLGFLSLKGLKAVAERFI